MPGLEEPSCRCGCREGLLGGRGFFGRFGNLNIMLFFDENSKQIIIGCYRKFNKRSQETYYDSNKKSQAKPRINFLSLPSENSAYQEPPPPYHHSVGTAPLLSVQSVL